MGSAKETKLVLFIEVKPNSDSDYNMGPLGIYFAYPKPCSIKIR
jgi:hypothetical protein